MFYASSSNNCNAFYSTYLSMHCVPHVLYIFTIVKTCCTPTNGRKFLKPATDFNSLIVIPQTGGAEQLLSHQVVL